MPDAGHARRGQRDPNVAARIARSQQIAANGEAQPMPDDTEDAITAALEAQRAAEGYAVPPPQTIDYQPEYAPDAGVDIYEKEPLYPGDEMTAKGGCTFNVDGESAWASFESRTTIQPGEPELDAFERLEAQVETRLMDVVAGIEERIEARNESKNAARRAKRIVPIDPAGPYR